MNIGEVFEMSSWTAKVGPTKKPAMTCGFKSVPGSRGVFMCVGHVTDETRAAFSVDDVIKSWGWAPPDKVAALQALVEKVDLALQAGEITSEGWGELLAAVVKAGKP